MVKRLLNWSLNTTAISYKELTNINDVIMEALKLFEQDLKDGGIEAKTELGDNLPLISIDQEQMKKALANLIRNSIEAMQDKLKILKITSRISDGRMEIQVSDTGKGIPKDKIKNIFEPFFTSKTRGPGVGLTFTLKIIQEHRGTVSVESEPGKGTIFTIRLPLKRGRVSSYPTSSRPRNRLRNNPILSSGVDSLVTDGANINGDSLIS
jgi:two-component system sensor histidine kinase/response regulator